VSRLSSVSSSSFLLAICDTIQLGRGGTSSDVGWIEELVQHGGDG